MTTHSLQPRGFVGYTPARRLRFARWPAGLVLVAGLLALLAVSRADSVPPVAADRDALSFVPNVGQTDDSVRFAAHTSGASFYFTQKDAVLAFDRGDEGLALRLGFVGANPTPAIEGSRARAGTVNYLLGSDAEKWQTGIPTFGEVVYRELWPGIDMVFRGSNGKLKYEFVVAPGADPRRIGLTYRGAESLVINGAGQLLIGTPWGTLRDEKPRSFQVVDERRVPVESSFALRGEGYGFALGPYDRSRPVVVDPGLLFATYLGGSGANFDEVRNLAVGPDGSTYVTGYTESPDFPITAGAFDSSHVGGSEAFVTKLDANGALVYSTFLGGSAHEGAAGIAVDAAGHAYVAGGTGSSDFPTTPGALASVGISGDGFVTKLAPNGASLVYSTYLGAFGASEAADIAVDASGAAYVVGNTSGAGFPATAGAFDETMNGFNDLFVAKLNPAGSAFAYSTYLGGQECDFELAMGVALDGGGNAYVTGITSAGDFPTTPDAFDTTGEACSGDLPWDAFVTKVAADGSDLAYSTFLNGELGNQDIAFNVAVDASGSAYVVGATKAPDFPTTVGAYDRTLAGNLDGYIAKLNPSGSALVFSTYLGGTGPDNAIAVAVGTDGRVYVSGGTGAADFPTTAGAFDETNNGSDDAFLARLNASGSQLEYGSYFGGSGEDFGLWGIGVDAGGNATFGGYTSSTDLPTTPGAHDSTFNGGFYDGWVAKLATGATAPDSDGDGIPDDEDIEPIRDRIAALIAADPGSPAADKLEDSLAKVDSAIAKLAAGDRQGALGELEGAVGDIDAAVRSRHLDATVGTELMRDIAAFARIIATQSIDAAKARNGDAGKIAEAEAARAQGDARVARNRFKEAVVKYKDAVAKAESA